MNFPALETPADEPANRAEASWLAVGALGIGAFAIVTTEFLPVGLLPMIATSLGQTEGRTGLMVTVPGVLAAIAAPVSVMLAGKRDRRWILVALMALLVLSNLMVAFSNSFASVLAGRLLLGVVVGGFWTLAGSLGPRMRPAEGARASALILSGVSLGTVAGVPAGALLGELLGWRWAFGVASGIALVVLLLLVAVLKPLPADDTRKADGVRLTMGLPKVKLGIAAIILLFVGQFGAYTFISPFLLQVTGIAPLALGGVLLAYGIAAFSGNLLGGWAVGRGPRGALISTALVLASALLLLALMGGNAWVAVPLTVLWGLGFGMLPIAMQSWMFAAAPKQLETVQALFVSLSQIAIGVGALIGGLLVDGMGIHSVFWIATATSLLTAALMLFGAGGRHIFSGCDAAARCSAAS